MFSKVKRPVRCADGFSISIQASRGHHCFPKSDVGPWTHFELGFPSEVEELILPYAIPPTFSIYGRVPIEIVEAVIRKHRGTGDEWKS